MTTTTHDLMLELRTKAAPLAEPTVAAISTKQLARQAAAIGYAPLLEQVNKVQAGCELAAALARAGVPVLPTADVERYKGIAARRANRRRTRWLIGAPAAWLASCAVAAAVIAPPSAVFAVLTVAVFGALHSNWPKWQWNEYTLANYGQARDLWTNGGREVIRRPLIPAEALMIAVQVAELMPDAQLTVQALEPGPVKPACEPFLVVSWGNRRYYLAVWDEPGFVES